MVMEKGEKITKKERKTTGEMWLAGGVWEDTKKDWSNVAYFDVKCLMKKSALKIKSNYLNHSKLHMLTACRCLKSPWSLSLTSAHPIMVTLVNIMVMNGWLTPISFHVNRPSHFWDKGISDSDLETSNQCTSFSLHIKIMFDLEKHVL